MSEGGAQGLGLHKILNSEYPEHQQLLELVISEDPDPQE